MSYVATVLAELHNAVARLEADHPDLAHEDRAWVDSIDGETSALDLAEHLAEKCLHLAAMEDAAAERVKALQARARRFDADQKRIKALILMLMEGANINKLVRPSLTLSARSLPPRLLEIDESKTPSDYMKQPPPVPDKTKIAEALKLGGDVDGWSLSNGARTVAVLVR